MERLKRIILAAGIVAILFPLSEIHAQNTPAEPAAVAEPTAPAAPVAVTDVPAAPEGSDKGEAAPVDSAANMGEGAPKADAASTDSVEGEETTAGDLLEGVAKTVNDWKTLGWLAGLIALLNFLMGLLRFKPIDTWLIQYDKKWLKPWVAMGLGALIMGLSTYQTDANILNSIVAGLLAGLGSTGAHEAITGKLTFGPKEKAEVEG